MDIFLDKIMDFIIQNKKIDNDEVEIVRYGLEMTVLKITFFFAALIVSLFMNSVWQYIIFLCLVYCVLMQAAITKKQECGALYGQSC